jgi:hypothetical protein
LAHCFQTIFSNSLGFAVLRFCAAQRDDGHRQRGRRADRSLSPKGDSGSLNDEKERADQAIC